MEDEADEGDEVRRKVRAGYRSLQDTLKAAAKEIGIHDDSRFRSVIVQMETLHESVKRPREQISDAETMLQITTALLENAKSVQLIEGLLTPLDFQNALLSKFGSSDVFDWKSLGSDVISIFRDPPGISTMIGPMNIQPKLRKPTTVRSHKEPLGIAARPDNMIANAVHKAEVDTSITEMFSVLKAERNAKLEALVLNRRSFAQTVENIFALTFLVKDGRVEINVLDDGSHLVAPRNAPTSAEREHGTVNTQFVFRLDYSDWKVMQSQVQAGDELMHDRRTTEPLEPGSLSEPVAVFTSALPLRRAGKRPVSALDATGTRAQSVKRQALGPGNGPSEVSGDSRVTTAHMLNVSSVPETSASATVSLPDTETCELIPHRIFKKLRSRRTRGNNSSEPSADA